MERERGGEGEREEEEKEEERERERDLRYEMHCRHRVDIMLAIIIWCYQLSSSPAMRARCVATLSRTITAGESVNEHAAASRRRFMGGIIISV